MKQSELNKLRPGKIIVANRDTDGITKGQTYTIVSKNGVLYILDDENNYQTLSDKIELFDMVKNQRFGLPLKEAISLVLSSSRTISSNIPQ